MGNWFVLINKILSSRVLCGSDYIFLYRKQAGFFNFYIAAIFPNFTFALLSLFLFFYNFRNIPDKFNITLEAWRKHSNRDVFSQFSHSRLCMLIFFIFRMNPHTVFVLLSLQLSVQLWDSRPFHPKVYLKIIWLFDTDHGKINKIESWKFMEVGITLSAVDRSGLGGWLLKGICSSHHTYFQFSGYIPGRLQLFWCFKSMENKFSTTYFIYFIVVFYQLVIQKTFCLWRRAIYLYLILFYCLDAFWFVWVFSWMLSVVFDFSVEPKKLKIVFRTVTCAKQL